MDAQNVRTSIGKARILVPRLELENSASVKQAIQSLVLKCQNFPKKNKDSGAQAGVRKFSFCETELTKA